MVLFELNEEDGYLEIMNKRYILGTVIMLMLLAGCGSQTMTESGNTVSTAAATAITGRTTGENNLSSIQETTEISTEYCKLNRINEKDFILESSDGNLYRIDISFLPDAKVGDGIEISYKEKKLLKDNTYKIEPEKISKMDLIVRPAPAK